MDYTAFRTVEPSPHRPFSGFRPGIHGGHDFELYKRIHRKLEEHLKRLESIGDYNDFFIHVIETLIRGKVERAREIVIRRCNGMRCS